MKKIIKELFSYFAISVTLICCNNPINIDGFEQSKWSNDSLACNGYRISHYKLVYDNRSLFVGQNKNAVIKFLGNPNLGDAYSFSYFVNAIPQCDPSHRDLPIDSVDSKAMIFTLKDQRVTEVNIIQP